MNSLAKLETKALSPKKGLCEFFEFIHGEIQTKNNIYFSIMQKRDKQVVNRFYKSPQDAVQWLINSDITEYDTYFSVNEFNCPKRQSKFVFSFQGFYLDLDLHTILDSNLIILNVDLFLSYLDSFVKKELALNPNFIIFTGRGIQLHYVLNKSLPRKNLEWLYKKLSEKISESIEDILLAMSDSDVNNFTLDSCYKDISRLSRVPYTYNTASHQATQILRFNKEKYDINFLREFFDVGFKNENNNYVKTRIPTKKVAFISKSLNLHNDRKNDLLKLLSLRNFDVTGYRELFLFLITYYNSFLDKRNNKIFAEEINNKFLEPLKDFEVTKALSGELAYSKWLEDKKSGYNYKNDTLIELLNISDEEQKYLKTIISKKEKARRRAEKRNWSNANRDAKRKVTNDKFNKVIKKNLAEGKTYNEIKEDFNISNNKIRKLVDKDKKTENKSNLEKEIEDMLSAGFTYNKISELLHVSKREIAKISKSLK